MKRRSKLPPSLHGRELTLNGNDVTAFEIKPNTYLWRNATSQEMREDRIYRLKYKTGVYGKNLYTHKQIEEMANES